MKSSVSLEPADQQQAYEMTRQAFDLSERFAVPVLLRLGTHLAHSRAPIRPDPPRRENPLRERDAFSALGEVVQCVPS